ncbi:hypothetical protein [Streptococcus thoraltensis]|uniref:hypothetical protein n=1 Tax=Streptococcus thoraltensis TaxID=55085 RepID=UPI00037F7767|nr:hypothetical protein [Streptococcus thoraltensis]QBX31132.1 hypothetical protein Javan616_0039 [Streptococcus phage Javan616]
MKDLDLVEYMDKFLDVNEMINEAILHLSLENESELVSELKEVKTFIKELHDYRLEEGWVQL